jgi:ribosomal protein S12 methylthiotransferase
MSSNAPIQADVQHPKLNVLSSMLNLQCVDTIAPTADSFTTMDNVHIITLGCPKNTVDSENMHRLLELNGYAVSDQPDEADIIVVNTCGFIQPAKEESIATALEAADYKRDGRCQGLIVTGCLAQRYTSELQDELTEADLVMGLAEESRIVEHCDRLLGRKREGPLKGLDQRHLHTPGHWAYLRISDGCDRTCAFCAIPGIRGQNKSVSIDRLVAEAHRLAAHGCRELALIAQDTMRYGADLYGKPRLVDLLKELVAVDRIEWIRLLYTYPTGWRDDLVELLAAEPKLCGYVDMPIQHADDAILSSMNRGTTRKGIRSLVSRLRDAVPHLTIRSSVIVGYPGETDDQFESLLDFLAETRFSRLVGFTYSHEEGTAAGNLEDTVPEEVKRERMNRVMALQEEIATETNLGYVGERFRVLIDEPGDAPESDWIGRTRMDAPEIDGSVFLSGEAEIGAFVEAEITDAAGYDLFGRILSVEEPPLSNLLAVESASSTE